MRDILQIIRDHDPKWLTAVRCILIEEKAIYDSDDDHGDEGIAIAIL